VKIHHMVQYTPEWWKARAGKITASSADRIITPGGKPSAQVDDYLDELVADILYGAHPNFFSDRPVTRAMEAGRETEPQARAYYAMNHDEWEVRQIGGIETDDGQFWCSPDAIATKGGAKRVTELKCPMFKTQVKYLRLGVLPAEYRPQCHAHLLIAGEEFEAVDFLSYAVGAPPFEITVYRDEFTVKLAAAMKEAAEKLQAALAKIRGM
jgi:hypothetical protein